MPLATNVKPLTVSELTACIQQTLQDGFPSVWVTGELSNLKRPPSGHIYADLKDAQAVLHVVMWQSTARRLRFELTDGMQVITFGRITVYPKSGNYQLVIDELHPKGIGARELALQQLKEKLAKRGWFDAERKKPLPLFPRRIALVTSPTGAAIRDMLQIIPRRWPGVEIWICPVSVQGDGAGGQVAAAIHALNRVGDIDVMIVGRGGGSIEDLWAFNEEIVAEAIFRSKIPVISAVGHQIDFTIADLVADRRAATPSEAAELVVPNQEEEKKNLDARLGRLQFRLQERYDNAVQQLTALGQRRVFRLPLERVRQWEQLLDEKAERLERGVRRCLDRCRRIWQSQSERLDGLSPLNVLRRGYSLTRKEDETQVIRSAADVQIGERIVTRVSEGRIVSRVEETEKSEPEA